MSEKLAEQFAEQVVKKVIQQGVKDALLEALLDAVRGHTREAVMEVLLQFGGRLAREQNETWVRELSSTFIPKGGRQPANPAEMEEAILASQAISENEARQEGYRRGQKDGFLQGAEKGAKFGFGAGRAGKSLEEVLTKIGSGNF